MNNNIRDLLMSENKDDVALGLIIAHKEGISPEEIDRIIFDDDSYSADVYRKTVRTFRIYLNYSEKTLRHPTWKEEMFI